MGRIPRGLYLRRQLFISKFFIISTVKKLFVIIILKNVRIVISGRYAHLCGGVRTEREAVGAVSK